MATRDRRTCVRVDRKSMFQFKKMGDGVYQEKFCKGRMVDFSVAGIRFVTDEKLEKNTPLLIRLDLDVMDDESVDWQHLWDVVEGSELEIIGSVMWCLESGNDLGHYEVGTRFLQKATEM